jgi:hypothetical protein
MKRGWVTSVTVESINVSLKHSPPPLDADRTQRSAALRGGDCQPLADCVIHRSSVRAFTQALLFRIPRF